jgi:acyl carrier protein
VNDPGNPRSTTSDSAAGGTECPSGTFREAMLLDDGRQFFPFSRPSGERAVFTSDDEKSLREALKRCSAPTREAACAYRRTRDAGQLPVVIHGLIEHYVQRNAHARLRPDADNTRLVEDLAIDSLTMLEIVFLAEEVLQVSIDNEELRAFETVGEVRRFLVSKLAPAPPAFCDFKGESASSNAGPSSHKLSEPRQSQQLESYDERQS